MGTVSRGATRGSAQCSEMRRGSSDNKYISINEIGLIARVPQRQPSEEPPGDWRRRAFASPGRRGRCTRLQALSPARFRCLWAARAHRRDDNPIARGDEPLRLTDHFRCARSRLGKVALCALDAVIGASSRKLSRLDPFDIWVEQLHCRVDITAIERGIGGTKSCKWLFQFVVDRAPCSPFEPDGIRRKPITRTTGRI
jgi:hypothetical protein